MQRVLVLSLALVFSMAVIAKADPVVTLGTYNFNAGLTGQAIQIFVWNNTLSSVHTGANANAGVQGLILGASIADSSGALGLGGGNPALVGSPVFTAGTPGSGGSGTDSAYTGGGAFPTHAGLGVGGDPLTGTIFSTNLVPGTASTDGPHDGGSSDATDLQMSLSVVGGKATMSTNSGAPSLLATIYIDTVGAIPGSNWQLLIGGENLAGNGDAADNMNFADLSAFHTALTDGMIHINVPEPSTVLLGLFAAAGLAAVVVRRRRTA